MAKEKFFLEVGKTCNEVAFIKSGMLRIFYPNDKGEETTCYFSLPNEFVTSFSSFTTQNPSTENIQAILPTELFVISKQNLELLYQSIGYKAMMKNKMTVIHGLYNYIMANSIRFTPRKWVLPIVRKIQGHAS